MPNDILKKIDDLKDCFNSDHEEKDYSLDELVEEMKNCLTDYPEKTLAIHMFGIKYGKCIKKHKYSVNEIVKKSGLSDSYFVEINKGIKLSQYVNVNDNKEELENDNYVKFKNLLSWFITQLRINLDVIPGNKTSGKGADGDKIRNLYIEWRDYGDFTLDCAIQSGFHNKTSKVNYIHNGKFNVRPHFDGGDIDYVYLSIYDKDNENQYQAEIDSKFASNEYNITDLDLFNDNAPNDRLKELYDNYVKMMDFYSVDSHETIDFDRIAFDFLCDNKSGINLIVYGTPGCGKSYYVQHTLLYKGGYRFDDNGINCLDAIRTTFFQDYTNTDFVGQIMPVVNADKSVTYEFNPGPFTLALNKAIQNPDRPIALVIEELNRGNAASIFGDIFQLLDRDNGTSVYNITNVNIQKYLEEQNPTMKFDFIKLPSNLSIFATMNTSDQNVFTLDTAFKRRWKFEKIKNTFLADHGFKESFIPGMDMDWEEFCNSINEFIVNDKNFINSEDKQLGVYFVDEKGLRKVQGDGSTEESRKEFAYKVFEYLWDDVAKYDREKWFNNIKTLDTLIDKYVAEGADDKSGINVFSDGIFKKK